MYNIPNVKENVDKITIIESEILNHTIPNLINNTYSNYDNFLWIKSTSWPFGYYKNFSKISGINAFPDKNLKNWIKVIKNKGKGIKKRIGLFLRIPFMKKEKWPVNANFYFNKVNFGILIYCDSVKKVVKFNQTNHIEYASLKIQNEVESLKKANAIQHDVVYTPMLLNYYNKDGILFFEQDLVIGKDLHHFSEAKVLQAYNSVFDFMFLYYKSWGVKATPIIIKEYINNPIVEKYFCEFNKGEELLQKFKEISKQNKKMLIGRIHGDLSLNNILIDKNNKVIILDWGESSEEYLSKDMKEHKRNTTYLYNQIVKDNNFVKDELYNLSDQIFVGIFDELSKLLYNHYVNKVFDPYLNSKINTKLKQLKTLT